jgi:DNA (cytosine-5)-methyltransferase 1
VKTPTDSLFQFRPPRLLDLFCGAGGCTKGYQQAGFHVVGVDINPQPNYCGSMFIKTDALNVFDPDWWSLGGLDYFDAIHASPPCQAHTSMNVMWNAKEHADLIEPVRERLIETGLPYVIENVVGAPLIDPFRLCGSSFGLGTATHELRRHRLFETNWPHPMIPPCGHSTRPTLGIYGDHARDRRRVPGENPERGRQFPAGEALMKAREAMEMPWADWKGLSQAVPPAFTRFIGEHLISYLKTAVAA